MIDPETKAYIDQQLRFYQRIRDERAAPDRTIYAEYTTAAAQSIPSHGSNYNVIDYGTKVKDTHNIVTTGASWVATLPAPGAVSVQAATMFASSTAWGLGESGSLILFYNGALYRALDQDDEMDSSGTGQFKILGGGTRVWCDTGDTLDIRIYNNSGSTIALYNSGVWNWVTICLPR